MGLSKFDCLSPQGVDKTRGARLVFALGFVSVVPMGLPKLIV